MIYSTLRNDFFRIQDLDINIIVIALALFGFKISSIKILLIQGGGGCEPHNPSAPVYTSAVNCYSEMLKNFYKHREKPNVSCSLTGPNENTLFALCISIYSIYNHICFLYLDIRVLLSIERV